jgi:hypothetical protein
MNASIKLSRTDRTLVIRVPLPSKHRGGKNLWSGLEVLLGPAAQWSLTTQLSKHSLEPIAGRQCWKAENMSQ